MTDPESRATKVRIGTDVCYNAQTAVDDKHKLIVAGKVTNEPTDRNWLSPMAIQAKTVMEVETLAVVADKGYSSAREVEACLELTASVIFSNWLLLFVIIVDCLKKFKWPS